jgi:uncharacterized protein YlxP (DUF503 family)
MSISEEGKLDVKKRNRIAESTISKSKQHNNPDLPL